jgi:hypothetical protein
MALNPKKTPSTTTPRTRPKKHPDGTVLINIPLPNDLHRKLRIRCLTDDLSLAEAVTLAVDAWLKMK